jgi:hypothetical protein
MRDYRRWLNRDKQILRKLWESDLSVERIAARLQRTPDSVSKQAERMELPPRRQIQERRDTREYWNPRKPFAATVSFLSGWLTTYGQLPVCGLCGQRVYRTESVVWTGGGSKSRLVDHACARAGRQAS